MRVHLGEHEQLEGELRRAADTKALQLKAQRPLTALGYRSACHSARLFQIVLDVPATFALTLSRCSRDS
jgi:hypothetical protein